MKEADVQAISHTRIGAALYSKFVKQRFIFPDPKAEPGKFTEQLLNLLKKEKYDCVLALEESTTKILLKNKEEIEKYTSALLTTVQNFDKANDKWEVLKMAVELNVPVPESYAPETPEEINA